jgi:hypothetical protein
MSALWVSDVLMEDKYHSNCHGRTMYMSQQSFYHETSPQPQLRHCYNIGDPGLPYLLPAHSGLVRQFQSFFFLIALVLGPLSRVCSWQPTLAFNYLLPLLDLISRLGQSSPRCLLLYPAVGKWLERATTADGAWAVCISLAGSTSSLALSDG